MSYECAKERGLEISRKPIVSVLVFVFIVALSFASSPAFANYALEVPSITSGTVVDEVYFYGNIDIGSSVDDVTAGIDKELDYTTDACGSGNNCPTGNACSDVATWNPAEIQTDNTDESAIATPWLDESSLAVFPDGSYLVAWAQGDDKFARFFNQDGMPDGNAFALNINNGSYSYEEVRIAAFPDGSGFVAVWQEKDNSGGIVLPGFDFAFVKAQLFDTSGNKVGGQISVNNVIDASYNLSVATYPDSSGFAVLYEAEYSAGGVYVQRFNRGGSQVGSQFALQHSSAYGIHGKPKAHTTSDGYVIFTINNSYDVYAWRYNTSGSLLGVSSLNNCTESYDAAYLPTVGYVVACTDSNDVKARVFDISGSAIGPSFVVNQYTSGYQGAESVSLLSNDRFIVTWKSVGQNNGYDGVYARIYDLWGNALSNEFSIYASQDLSHDFSNVAQLSNDSLVFIWESSNNDLLSRIFSNRVGLQKVNAQHGNQDAALQFKLTDPDSLESWCSPVRHYHYVDPLCGSGGAISYPGGYTNEESVDIGLAKPSCVLPYKSLQLYARSASLSNESCGVFGGWTSVGTQTTLTTQQQVLLSDATCYQFKWTITNFLDTAFDYTGTDILKVDRQSPDITITDNLTGGELQLDLVITDAQSGIANKTHRLNSNAAVPFSQNQVVIALQDGGNRVEIEAFDEAGNAAKRELFYTADLTPAAILIHSIKQGETYGAEIPLIYTSTQPLTNLNAIVDGGQPQPIPAVLSGLSDGAHTLQLQGRDADSNQVSSTVNFNVQSSAFNVVLISPQDIEYAQDTVTVQYASNMPLKNVSVSLDGGPAQTSLTLTNVSDGIHHVVLNAENLAGELTWASTSFTVNQVVPQLTITNLNDGDILTSTSVPVQFESSHPVTYEAGGSSGSLVSGASIELPGEGVHDIILTAMHPSGNSIQETVTVEVDLLQPQITIESPVEGVYPHRDIPIAFSSNTLLFDVQMSFDGDAIATLDDVPDGNHVFRIAAVDRAGRTVDTSVPFVVTHLDIVSPLEGQIVNYPEYPPLLPLIYDAGEELSAVTARLDIGDEQLLVAGSGNATHMQVSQRGQHKVRVRGSLNEFALTKSCNFKVLLKDVAVTPIDGIRYTYADCDETTSECTVTVTLTAYNAGDVDITDDIGLRFDHIKPDGTYGSETQLRTITDIPVGGHQRVELEPFRARLEDLFAVAVDPEGLLAGELLENNYHQVHFQATHIYDSKSMLPQSNAYLTGSSLINVINVAVFGNVSQVEFVTPNGAQSHDRTFVDTNGENGWGSVIDMGLLTPDRNCVHIYARDDNNDIVASRKHCFNVKEIAIPGAGYTLSWRDLESPPGSKRVDTSNIRYGDLAIESLLSVKNQLLSRSAAMLPKLDEKGRLSYVLFLRNDNVPSLAVKQVGGMGMWSHPVGHNLTVISIDPLILSCTALVEAIVRDAKILERFKIEIEQLVDDQLNLITGAINGAVQGYDYHRMLDDFLTNMMPGVFDMARIGGDTYLFGGAIFAGDIGALGPFGAYYFGILDGSISEPVVSVTYDAGEVHVGFDPGVCTLQLGSMSSPQFELNLVGTKFWTNVESKIHVNMAGQSMGADGFGVASLFSIPILPFFGYARAVFHPQDFDIPIYTAAEIELNIINNIPSLNVNGPPAAVMRLKKVRGPVLLAEAESLVHFVFGGYGQHWRAYWYMDLYGSSETNLVVNSGGMYGPIDIALSDAKYYSHSHHKFIYDVRSRTCVLAWCWWGGWGSGGEDVMYHSIGTPFVSGNAIDVPSCYERGTPNCK